MEWKDVGVYKLKPASSIALLFCLGKFVWNEQLHIAKNSLFSLRWQTEKKIDIDLFEITFTKLGTYDNVFGSQSHACLSLLSLCCLEKNILHPDCCKNKDFKVVLQNEYQIKIKLAKGSTEEDHKEDLQLINSYIESSVSAYIKLGEDLNECILCGDTRTNNYPCHHCNFLAYADLELFHKPNLWQCIGQGNRSIVLLEKGITYFNWHGGKFITPKIKPFKNEEPIQLYINTMTRRLICLHDSAKSSTWTTNWHIIRVFDIYQNHETIPSLWITPAWKLLPFYPISKNNSFYTEGKMRPKPCRDIIKELLMLKEKLAT